MDDEPPQGFDTMTRAALPCIFTLRHRHDVRLEFKTSLCAVAWFPAPCLTGLAKPGRRHDNRRRRRAGIEPGSSAAIPHGHPDRTTTSLCHTAETLASHVYPFGQRQRFGEPPTRLLRAVLTCRTVFWCGIATSMFGGFSAWRGIAMQSGSFFTLGSPSTEMYYTKSLHIYVVPMFVSNNSRRKTRRKRYVPTADSRLVHEVKTTSQNRVPSNEFIRSMPERKHPGQWRASTECR
ncbi:hypothetical protein B0T10DRAFT_249914 [Thelonectria olida]|uniref:Uncharacterized protein n=1 Tax=Thelonectria olida TaxID=1576542 RepID=A0A9P9ASC9_9HYPO|nr:hypothetical protein B0T10DRAFT_249914 [Thelonectria olida]